MEFIIITVIVVLIIFIFWPKIKKPATPITKSRTSPDMADPTTDNLQEENLVFATGDLSDKYLTARKDLGDTSGYFYRKIVCLSGEFDSFPLSAELLEDLWAQGAVIKGDEDDTCNVIIYGENADSELVRKTAERGTELMSKQELRDRLNR